MDDLIIYSFEIKSEKKSTAPLFRLSSWSEIYGGYDTRLYYGEGLPACMPNISIEYLLSGAHKNI